MKPPPFAYVAPDDVEGVVAELVEGGEEAKVLAGGQSLLPLLALRLAHPAVLVDVGRVAGLDADAPRRRRAGARGDGHPRRARS